MVLIKKKKRENRSFFIAETLPHVAYCVKGFIIGDRVNALYEFVW